MAVLFAAPSPSAPSDDEQRPSNSTSPLESDDHRDVMATKDVETRSTTPALKFGIRQILQQQPTPSQSETENEPRIQQSLNSNNNNNNSPWTVELHRRFWTDRLANSRRVGHPYQSRAAPKHKKPRTSFTKGQIAELETRFQEQKYLASTERATLAKDLDMSDSQVKTWFQNRRTKWRRQAAEEKEFERKATARLMCQSPYLASLHSRPTFYARPDVAI